MRASLLCSLLLIACGGPTATTQKVLHPEVMRGPAAGPSGKVLVITATCGALETECRNTWAPTVDQIVLGGLEFRGYSTIDPQSLRKDERKRHEHIEEHDSKTQHQDSSTGGGAALIGVLPFIGGGGSWNTSLTIHSSRHKTVILDGANFDDLRLEDKQALMQMAGASTVATIRVVVGANYGTWSAAQNVEVIVKLAAAETGDMRWASRCIASSQDYPNVENAIENAARCAASAFSLNQ